MAMVELNRDNFNKELEKCNVAVVEFYSDNCNVCKMLMPVLEELAQEKSGISFYKVNTKENMQLCMSYRVLSLPTTLIFKNGEQTDKFSGFKTKDEVIEILSKVL